MVDDTTSGVRLNAVPTTDNIPNKFLWSITTVSGNEKLIKNLGTNRYISQSSTSAVTPVTSTGTVGTDAYTKCVWRIVASNDYRELSNFAIPTRITVDVGQTKTISFSKSPTGAMWCDPSDFNYSFASGTPGIISVNSNTGKITGQKCGIATYTVTHKVTGRSNTVKVYVDGFTERLANHFDFADNAATLIRKVYDRVDKYHPSESVQKRAWRASRLLASFVYHDGSYDKWDIFAGEVVNQDNLKGYFVNTLKFSSGEYDILSAAIIANNHDKSNPPDFAHEQYALASRLAYITNQGVFGWIGGVPATIGGISVLGLTKEQISYLGGWLGDATLPYNNGTTSLKNDDYCADLDAENVFRLIEKGKGDVNIVSAYKTYHSSLTASNTRAEIFKTHINYISVMCLVCVRLCGEPQLWNEELIFSRYHDTYNFLHSLKDGLAELRDYPDYLYSYDFAPKSGNPSFSA